jgi:hypothetical protein
MYPAVRRAHTIGPPTQRDADGVPNGGWRALTRRPAQFLDACAAGDQERACCANLAKRSYSRAPGVGSGETQAAREIEFMNSPI